MQGLKGIMIWIRSKNGGLQILGDSYGSRWSEMSSCKVVTKMERWRNSAREQCHPLHSNRPSSQNVSVCKWMCQFAANTFPRLGSRFTFSRSQYSYFLDIFGVEGIMWAENNALFDNRFCFDGPRTDCQQYSRWEKISGILWRRSGDCEFYMAHLTVRKLKWKGREQFMFGGFSVPC